MTVDQFIATHPDGWYRMMQLHGRPTEEQRLFGMVELLAIIGGLSENAIMDALAQAAGAP